MEKSFWVFVEGTRVMQTSGLQKDAITSVLYYEEEYGNWDAAIKSTKPLMQWSTTAGPPQPIASIHFWMSYCYMNVFLFSLRVHLYPASSCKLL